MKVLVAASGSEGNAAIFESKSTRVLVDAGIGWQALVRKIKEGGVSGLPDAIVVTHAHADHVGIARRLAKRLRIPIWATPATARVAHLGDSKRIRIFKPREPFEVGDLRICPLPIPHDAAQVALTISDGKFRAGIATDLGVIPPALPGHLEGCDVLLIESNHDEVMLELGPYPLHLKSRIRSSRGHLSNRQTGRLLRDLGPATNTVVLMHLSRTNNTPDKALESAREALAGRRVHLYAAMQDDSLVVDATGAPPKESIAGVRKKIGKRGALPGQMSLF